jgi:hypothetical protein
MKLKSRQLLQNVCQVLCAEVIRSVFQFQCHVIIFSFLCMQCRPEKCNNNFICIKFDVFYYILVVFLSLLYCFVRSIIYSFIFAAVVVCFSLCSQEFVFSFLFVYYFFIIKIHNYGKKIVLRFFFVISFFSIKAIH